MQLLVRDAGADHTSRDVYGKKPRHYAEVYKHTRSLDHLPEDVEIEEAGAAASNDTENKNNAEIDGGKSKSADTGAGTGAGDEKAKLKGDHDEEEFFIDGGIFDGDF